MQCTFRFDRSKIRRRLRESADQEAVRITQYLVDRFIAKSPVFSGNFRASWNVSEGQAVFVNVDSGSPSFVLPPPIIKVSKTSTTPVFHISNGRPYAQAIEYGWSKRQAPLGIVRVTLASMR